MTAATVIAPIREEKSVGYGFAGALAAGSAIGGAAGGYIGVKGGQEIVAWAEQVKAADSQLLSEGHTQLPPMPAPDAPTGRKDRHIVLCFAAGIALGGFLVWLVAGIGAVFLQDFGNSTIEAGEQAEAGEIVVGAFIFGGMAGLCGFVIPGVFIGCGLWLMESRARMREIKADATYEVWQNREELRRQLEAGEITPNDALTLLKGGDLTRSAVLEPPTPAMPIPEPRVPHAPMVILALAAAVATHGYVRTVEGAHSTPARVQRILSDPAAPERETTTIWPVHTQEAEDVWAWALSVYEAPELDRFRERVGELCVHPEIEPDDAEAIRTLAAGVGAYRRARSLGRA